MASQEVKRAWDTKVGKRPVGAFGIVLLTIVFAAEALLAVYGMMAFWPKQPGTSDARRSRERPRQALFFGDHRRHVSATCC